MRSAHPRFTSVRALTFALIAACAVAAACALQGPERVTAPQATPSLSVAQTPVDPSRTYFEFQVEQPVTLQRGGFKVPKYPPELRQAKVEGEVVAAFVVDTNGLVDVSTFKTIKSTNDQFTEAVRTALADYRFSPAMVGGRPVKQLVQQPFLFNLSER